MLIDDTFDICNATLSEIENRLCEYYDDVFAVADPSTNTIMIILRNGQCDRTVHELLNLPLGLIECCYTLADDRYLFVLDKAKIREKKRGDKKYNELRDRIKELEKENKDLKLRLNSIYAILREE